MPCTGDDYRVMGRGVLVLDLPHNERLVYFWGHVGGESPAEAVHVEMTRMMVAELVPPDQREEFIELCLEGYALNFHWCEAITTKLYYGNKFWKYQATPTGKPANVGWLNVSMRWIICCLGEIIDDYDD